MRLLDQVRHVIRKKHYSIRTEQAYTDWIKRFILFHGKKHPKEMGEAEISQFISHLAVKRETFEKCSFLFKFKECENFNHRNTLRILRIKI
jgi:hypothetical protein